MFPFWGWLSGLSRCWAEDDMQPKPCQHPREKIDNQVLVIHFLRTLSETKNKYLAICWLTVVFFLTCLLTFFTLSTLHIWEFCLMASIVLPFPNEKSLRHNFNIKPEWKSKLPNSPKQCNTNISINAKKAVSTELDKKTYPVLSVKGLLKHTAVGCYVSTSSMIWI